MWGGDKKDRDKSPDRRRLPHTQPPSSFGKDFQSPISGPGDSKWMPIAHPTNPLWTLVSLLFLAPNVPKGEWTNQDGHLPLKDHPGLCLRFLDQKRPGNGWSGWAAAITTIKDGQVSYFRWEFDFHGIWFRLEFDFHQNLISMEILFLMGIFFPWEFICR